MTRYRVNYVTKIGVTVELEAPDEDRAADESWEYAEAYLNTLAGDGLHVTAAHASLDGIGADDIEEAQA